MTSMTPDAVTATRVFAVFGCDSMHTNTAEFVRTRMEVSDMGGGSQTCFATQNSGVFGISFPVSSNLFDTLLLANDSSMATGFEWCGTILRLPVKILFMNL